MGSSHGRSLMYAKYNTVIYFHQLSFYVFLWICINWIMARIFLPKCNTERFSEKFLYVKDPKGAVCKSLNERIAITFF